MNLNQSLECATTASRASKAPSGGLDLARKRLKWQHCLPVGLSSWDRLTCKPAPIFSFNREVRTLGRGLLEYSHCISCCVLQCRQSYESESEPSDLPERGSPGSLPSLCKCAPVTYRRCNQSNIYTYTSRLKKISKNYCNKQCTSVRCLID